MDFLNILTIILWEAVTQFRCLQEESIMHVSSWMTLRLEQSVEVPERTLNKSAGRHLIEAHFKQDFSEKLSYFQ